MDALIEALRSSGVRDVRGLAPLAESTTLRVGGPARALVTAESDTEVAVVGRIAAAFEVPVLVLGRGSNLLVGDAGWPGIAVRLGRTFRGVAIDGCEVRVGAAEPLPVLAVRLADAGLGGFAWGCAVPGTIGGAIRMNAGAHGHDMAEHLVEADVVRLGTGARETWPAALLSMRYRTTDLPKDAVVVAARLRLVEADPSTIHREMESIRDWRRVHQPINEPSCGSVFTNPPGGSAGALIDASGLKGLRRGGARVSDRHANFIVTEPGATATDVVALIDAVRTAVLDRTGIELTTEVVQVGAAGHVAGADDGDGAPT
jgi:UDP-N-acetylmuramate dehydrogenase